MGESQLLVISREADTEPMLQVQLEGRLVQINVDTGATYTYVSPKHALHLPNLLRP